MSRRGVSLNLCIVILKFRDLSRDSTIVSITESQINDSNEILKAPEQLSAEEVYKVAVDDDIDVSKILDDHRDSVKSIVIETEVAKIRQSKKLEEKIRARRTQHERRRKSSRHFSSHSEEDSALKPIIE